MAEEWEIIKIVGTNEEATIVVGFLQSSGIEAEAESLHASEFPADIGDLATVNIRVPAERAEEAKALLNQREDVATGDEGAMAGEPLPGGAPSEGPIEP
jgi:flagellar basal body L-ring protein FlgH